MFEDKSVCEKSYRYKIDDFFFCDSCREKIKITIAFMERLFFLRSQGYLYMTVKCRKCKKLHTVRIPNKDPFIFR